MSCHHKNKQSRIKNIKYWAISDYRWRLVLLSVWWFQPCATVTLGKRMLFTLLSSWIQIFTHTNMFLFFCLHQPLFLHKLWDSSCSHAIASENAGDAPQSSSLFPLRKSREVLSFHTNHIFPGWVKAHSEQDDPSVRKQRRSVWWILPSYLWFCLQHKRNRISCRGTHK